MKKKDLCGEYNMQILYYYSVVNEMGHELLEILEKLDDQIRIKTYRDWKIFKEELMEPKFDNPILLVLILRKEEILNAISIRDRIHEYKLILILSDDDDEEDAISLGHNLRPNFIAYNKGDLGDIEVVLKKMLHLE
ncbi:MAG: hypothetical protein JW755_06600 [Candidatus Aminicenantes bacterium]|nr:hypothetical protein [Candidatus Aminicenantes bacterium]